MTGLTDVARADFRVMKVCGCVEVNFMMTFLSRILQVIPVSLPWKEKHVLKSLLRMLTLTPRCA